jgi:hypothetical protein
MHNHDPKMLRKLAATYRPRAITEPGRANVFLEIAKDMEKHAGLIEGADKTVNRPPHPGAAA